METPMSRLRLIIETPCGGDSGHRFLTSCADLTERDIARISADAIRTPVSRNYISVSREVTQSLKNSTVRIGTEQIVLHGVGIGDIRPADIAAVQDALRALFASLQQLTDTIDWRSAGRSTVIARPELREWIERPEFRELLLTPSAANTSRLTQDSVSKHKRRLPRLVVWVVAAAVIATLVVAVAILVQIFNGRDGPAPRPPDPPGRAAFQQFVRDWDCPPDELGASLLRAANWDRRQQADVIGVDSMLTDGEVLAFMDKISATSQPAQFLLSPALEREDGFRRFVMVQGATSAKDARVLRRWLFLSWQRFSELKRNALFASEFLHEIDGGDAFARFIVMIAELQFDVGTGEDFREPATPLFDRQDVMIYRVLTNIHQVMGDTGLAQVLVADGHVERDLSTFIAKLSESRSGIARIVGDSRNSAMNDPKVPAEGVGVVRDAYEGLEQFLLKLSAVDVHE